MKLKDLKELVDSLMDEDNSDLEIYNYCCIPSNPVDIKLYKTDYLGENFIIIDIN